MEPLDDNRLMQRIADRDPAALEELYDRYERVIYSFAIRIVHEAMAAEEVVQELFLRIWNRAESYDHQQGKLTTWMFTITRNIAIDLLRKRTRTAEAVEDQTLLRIPDESRNTEAEVQRKWLGHAVRKALSLLSGDQQEVIESIYFGGLTQQEVSDRYKIPLGTVKSRTRLAMKQLQKRLAAEGITLESERGGYVHD
ncbi:sigma-70 family RNA polymerase sigma factor [Paenibacillus sp. JX-17]|uniref:Sigma-70 family RNA polymerase sigma factor n=1 Tax=Paenibacillus lacisoli TaxID=3064525 RepID=A0ABT9CCT4_9BACL|nr:sigma-70 family RNA polymerase sigma factor [Paenibacillus sp. JX-17]MDO7906685.1 sigma-70 family RNA polymerase sigma factor [Paenibacillus sp. JX-17]